MRGRSLLSRVPGATASLLTLLILLTAARYRAVIHESVIAAACLAGLLAAAVLLLALAGWTLAATRSVARSASRPARGVGRARDRAPGDAARGEAPAGRLAAMRAALAEPDACSGGCGRPAARREGRTGGPDDPRPCPEHASGSAAAVRPFVPPPAPPDNRPPTPDAAFDEFAASHQELQP
jgi:hypothetical protein